ncbi:unnamed protein product [Cylindrotheca closterium]|uniref:Uncharacterized protein n=1 Tax=Cylindrotheca closterium TaxID=2856 RepID=A0AAD2FQ37_9STRA|nr:unnamed protein product [Cylindrotheca closterium]
MKTSLTNAILALLFSIILPPCLADDNVVNDIASIVDLQIDPVIASLKSDRSNDFGHHADWMASPVHRTDREKQRKRSFVSEKEFHIRNNKRHRRSQEQPEDGVRPIDKKIESKRLFQELKFHHGDMASSSHNSSLDPSSTKDSSTVVVR